MINILIVEDESIVALEISNFVKTLGFNPIATVSNGKKAIEIIHSSVVDLILMDVYIKGGMDGISVAQQVNKIKNIPIIYISAFSDDTTLQRAIETNPSTYLIKPFHEKELEVAIKIALKQNEKGFDEHKIGDIILDQEFSYDSLSEELLCISEVVHLTKQERQLLQLLLKHKNQIVSIYDLENEIWPDKESNENTRRALVSRLRAKLNYKFLHTIHSVGYKINF